VQLPPPNGVLVYSTDDIMIVNADGSDPLRLTTREGDEFDPSWSPDGSMIAYRDSHLGINHNDEIYVMKADGSGQRDLTRDPANDWSPAWSPDGTRIAFSSERPGDTTRNIYLMWPDGTHLQRLTNDQIEAEYPAWSPNGKHIAFAAYIGGGNRPGEVPNYDIFVMNADGTDPHDLTFGSSRYEAYPAWSPDGLRIAFDSDRNAPPTHSSQTSPDSDIFVMNLDGTNVVDISRHADSNERYPDWSPDGLWIAFASDQGLVFMAADGSGQEIRPGVQGDFPAWRPAIS
jgi:Tol biopolymer transport system component